MGDAGTSSGQHKIIDLPDIFQSLANKRWTGTLEVIARDRNVFFYFKDGVVQHSKASASKLVLGQALFKLGKLDESDLNLAQQSAEDGGKRFGQVCIELGFVTEADIKEALTFQAREGILDAFTWEDIDAKFHPGDPPLPSVFGQRDLEVRLGLSPMGILMEAARRSDEWNMVKEQIPALAEILAPVADKVPTEITEGGDGPVNSPIARRILNMIDGYRSVEEVADLAPVANFEAIKLVAEFVKAGLLRRLEGVELAKLGLELDKEGRIEKALALYELAAARGLADRIDLAKRIARAYQLLGKQQESIDRWLKLAKRTEEQDRVEVAIESYRAALAIDPKRIDVEEKLVRLLIVDEGRGQEAIEQLQSLIQTLEAAPEKDADKLIWAHSEVLELKPDDEAALRRCAELHLQKKDKVQAIVRFEELAQALLTRGASEDAIAIYYRVLEIDEECLEGRLGLAQALAKTGATDEAVREYRRLADILFRSGLIANSVNWGFLIKVYESIVELEPSSTPAWEWLAKAYHENGHVDMAISRYLGMAQSLEAPEGEPVRPEIVTPLKKVVELAPDRFDVRTRLAKAHLALAQVERGVATYHGLAEAALAKGDAARATEALDEALHADPFHLDSRRLLAKIHEQRRETALAQALWRDIGGLCLRAGVLDQASDALRRAVELNPSDLAALEELAKSEEKRGKLREAHQTYVQLAEGHKARENLGLAREHAEHAQRIVGTARASTQRVRAIVPRGTTDRLTGGNIAVVGSMGQNPTPPVSPVAVDGSKPQPGAPAPPVSLPLPGAPRADPTSGKYRTAVADDTPSSGRNKQNPPA